jgi:non-ribosomal peptide synthetase-like protein
MRAVTIADARFLHELFELQADRRPLDPAVIFRDRQLTYREVEREANRLARLLRSLGAGPGRFVGLYLDRSDQSVIAILAVLKAGAAYVPVDPVYPSDRVRHILTDANAGILLTDRARSSNAAAWGLPIPIVVVDDPSVQDDIARQTADRLTPADTGVTPADLCYVMYTSGTTGYPKGIMTEHRHVVAFTHAFQEVCRIEPADRVYHGFSLGFDGSTEELCMAFVAGAAVVVGPAELARLCEETGRYLTAHGVTYFSTVPTFLGLIKQDVPSLRLLIVSGEPCPPALVRQWVRPGRRMLNVYGPTETTVNTTAWECQPEAVVSIGRPLSGYDTYVLDDEMRPVHDQPGELYIGGVGVSRGYLNQPALTATHFLPNPFARPGHAGNMYRTGDLVERSANGELRFLGRIDTQVKVRGYRIELDEIEAVLREDAAVDAAVVTVVTQDDQQHLAAFVVPATNKTATIAAVPIDRGAILARLRNRLPPYMVPAFLDIIDELPRVASGKVDRRRLPEPRTRLIEIGRTVVPPRTELESRIAALWERLFRTSPISVEADFFMDLGGDSLLATSLVTTLATALAVHVSLRDVYAHPTIAGLSAHIAATASAPRADRDPDSGTPRRPSSREMFERTSPLARGVSVALQALCAMGVYGLIAVIPFLMGMVIFSVRHHTISPANGVGLVAGMLFMGYPLWLKWLIIGRIQPGQFPLWGFAYVRFWLMRRLQVMSGVQLLAGTPLMSLYYRLMGARIGRNCLVDTAYCAAFDLVTIGDDSSVGAETQLLGYRVEDGCVHLGRVEIGRRCFVGMHSTIGLNSRMEDDTKLGDLSLLPDGVAIPRGQSWRGSPASRGPVPLPDVKEPDRPAGHPMLFGALYLVLAGLLGVLVIATGIPAVALLWLARAMGGWGPLAGALVAAVPVSMVSFCLLIAAVKAVVLRRMPPGTCRVDSGLFVRKWVVDALLALSRTYLRPVYTTVYLAPWLRLLGARIGRLAEISTVSQIAPDLADLGDQSFFADGSMIGGRRFFRGHMQVARSHVGRRSFVGNNAILPVGFGLGDACLLGVLSMPPDRPKIAPDGTEWLGAPSFALPHRNKVEGFDLSVTFEPTRGLYAHRLAVDAVRVLLPGVLAVLGGCALYPFLIAAWTRLPWVSTAVLLPLVATAVAAGLALGVVAVKVLVMGHFRPVVKPLWCPYVWWNEVVNGAWETLSVPVLAPLVGSPLFNVALRLMGCRIGRWAFVGTTLFSEFDLVDIGSFAALNEGVVVQNHLFEDRIMKSSHVTIGDECTVGNMAVVLYDSEMARASSIGPLSLLMKGSVIPEAARWIGIPASVSSVSRSR